MQLVKDHYHKPVHLIQLSKKNKNVVNKQVFMISKRTTDLDQPEFSQVLSYHTYLVPRNMIMYWYNYKYMAV